MLFFLRSRWNGGALHVLSFVVVVGAAAGGCFDGAFDGVAHVRCATNDDCPGNDVCLPDRCVARENPCVQLVGDHAEALPDGNACGEGGICVRATCAAAVCGDGVVSGTEECDEGGANSDVDADACRADCRPARCGDGVVDRGEVCDDGNARGADGCSADCRTVEACDGARVDEGEGCDDGNDNPADGCDGCRTQRWVADVVVSGSVEGTAARRSALRDPTAVAVDAGGRVYVADRLAARVQRLDTVDDIDDGGASGQDDTLIVLAGAGGPLAGGSSAAVQGDGGPATAARFASVGDVDVDLRGRVFVLDDLLGMVHVIDEAGIIHAFAGPCASVLEDGRPATLAGVCPVAVAVDPFGDVWMSDFAHEAVVRVDALGILHVEAGGGVPGLPLRGDGGPASEAALTPEAIAFGPEGDLYVVDLGDLEQDAGVRIRRISMARGVVGTITTVVGNGERGRSLPPDGALATSVALPGGIALAVDPQGRLTFALSALATTDYAGAIYRVDAAGRLERLAGTATNDTGRPPGDGVPARDAALGLPRGLAFDPAGRLLFTEADKLFAFDPDDAARPLATLAGGAAPNAWMGRRPANAIPPGFVSGLAEDPQGRLLFTDAETGGLFRCEPDGLLTHLVGAGAGPDASDGDVALDAALGPWDVAVSADGAVFVAEYRRVWRLDDDGRIVLVAGSLDAVVAPEEGMRAVDALLETVGIDVDAEGRVVFAGGTDCRVWRVEHDGTLRVLAGTGNCGASSGDGGPAAGASVDNPIDVAVDDEGRTLVLEGPGRVRRIEHDGTIATLAGAGEVTGDGTFFAVDAAPFVATRIDVAVGGGVLIADTESGRVRRFLPGGFMETLAGLDVAHDADEGPAIFGALVGPGAVAAAAEGGFYVADDTGRVFLVGANGIRHTVAGPLHPPGPGPAERARLYAPRALAFVDDARLLSVGEGRVQQVDLDARDVDVVFGYDGAVVDVADQARFARLLTDARGVAFDEATRQFFIGDTAASGVHVVRIDVNLDGIDDPPARWTTAVLPVRGDRLIDIAGLSFDDVDGSVIVVDEGAHCVRRLARNGALSTALAGRCGAAGSFPGVLDRPTHAIRAPSGALYVADTGNNRVLRFDGATVDVVVGDGSTSSAGEGAPAREFPVDEPRQLALDASGNLFVATKTRVRVVVNVDGDEDADGDDRVVTVFGGGARGHFPERDTRCLQGLAVRGGRAFVADACGGFLVSITRTTEP